MTQFDVYENNSQRTRDKIPYFVNIQYDLITSLNTRVMIPVGRNKEVLKNINISIEINNEKLVLLTSQITTININDLGQKVCSLKDNRDEIISSIDFLITGF